MNDKILRCFCFLGPIGNLIPIFPMVQSFRFYYLILWLGIVASLIQNNIKKEVKIILIIIFPMMIYILLSSLGYLSYNVTEKIAENPFMRMFLLVSLFSFVLFAWLGNFKKTQTDKYIILYLYGYITSMIAGYVIMLGYYIDVIPFDYLNYVEVLPQMGYGLLRFSPGSYPNEYGIVSSFALSIITYMLIHNDKRNMKFSHIVILYMIVFVALILTTTRAAYVGYVLSLVYLIVREIFRYNVKLVARIIGVVASFVAIVLGIIQWMFYDILLLFQNAYEGFINREGSTGTRFDDWNYAMENFLDGTYLFGNGFGTLGELHNVYLELFFELGLIGMAILIISLLLFSVFLKKEYQQTDFSSSVTMMGIINVLWFAASNHNINHHLTWFVIFLFLLPYKVKKTIM